MITMNQGGWVSRFHQGKDMAFELESTLSQLTSMFYDTTGNLFDYQGCKDSDTYGSLQILTRSLSEFDPGQLRSMEARKAFWLNLYNTLVLHLVMAEDVVRSIRDRKDFFTGFHYQLKDHAYSLDEIEHGILRANSPGYGRLTRPFKRSHPAYPQTLSGLDPRIHMALFCACPSSARLRIYDPQTVHDQLNEECRHFLHQHVHADDSGLKLPMLFHWYRKDFGDLGGMLDFLVRHHPDKEIVHFIKSVGKNLKFSWHEFDWTLNTR
ncbi:MAG: DUF547 domain-containing protein [Endozoicomonas sp.]